VLKDVWAVGDAYEAYVGRWSRRVSVAFLSWLQLPARGRWADIGCGTGALSAAILAQADPVEVVGVDPSEQFLMDARARLTDPRVRFHTGDAQALPLMDRHFSAVVSGLAINFVPDPSRAVAEFARITAEGGVAAAYVWDYAEGMQMMRYFWDAATAIDPAAGQLDELRRFALCRPEPLRALWTQAGLQDVAVEAIEVPTVFKDFDDYWGPFLGGQGPAPAYVKTLTDQHRDSLREHLRASLPWSEDGSISLTARAWAVKGTIPG
jgi:SAM-dependent methyltransferase